MGIVVLAIGTALTPLVSSDFGLVLTLGLLAAAGSGAGSFSVLIGAAAKRVPAESRGTASRCHQCRGVFGQFIFAPLLQKLISLMGWMGAMWTLAVITLATLPLARAACADSRRTAHAPAVPGDHGLRHAVRSALGDRSYLLLHAGFFTCGFHIAFLVTHLPGEVGLCGLPSSVASGRSRSSGWPTLPAA